MKQSNDLEISPRSSAVYVSFESSLVWFLINFFIVDVSSIVSEILDMEMTT